MKKKSRTRIGLLDIGRLPITPVENKSGFETRKEFYAREEREEREQQAAEQKRLDDERMKPIRELEDEIKAEAREQTLRVKKFFSQLLKTMAEFTPAEAPVDHKGNYPVRVGPRDMKKEFDVYKTFREQLSARGCELSEGGWSRLGGYLTSLAEGRGVEITADVYEGALARLVSLDVFLAYEIKGYEPPKKQVVPTQPVEQPESNIANIEDMPSQSREQERELRRVVGGQWSTEFAKWFFAWTLSLRTNFGYEFPIDQLGRKAADYLARWNLSPLSYASWDKVRVAFVRSGDFPNTMLTPSEILSRLIEQA